MREDDLPMIKTQLQARIVELCHRLLPKGHKTGGRWVSHNPRFSDDARHEPALNVRLSHPVGQWIDFRSGDKGDVLKLIQYCHHDCSLKDALDFARDMLGLKNLKPADRQRLKQDAEQRQVRNAEAALKARAFKLAKAQELFFKDTDEPGRRSAAELHAREYFAARQVPLAAIPHLSQRAFRFAAETEWWKGAVWAHGANGKFKQQAGPFYPAIHSAMRAASGAITCCHVTFLDPVKPAKAPVKPAKLMFGEAASAVIEVATGPTGKDFWDAEATPGPLIIAEGIETALSLALAIPAARVWAAGSLTGMGTAPVGLACVADITVARDNNDGNAQAQGQLAAALVALEQAGKPLVVINSHVGDDFNDLM